jgi:hypothetical protein
MRVSLKEVAVFVLLSTLISILLSPLRHPMFGSLDFNCIVLVLETAAYALLVWKGPFRISIYSVSILIVLGFAISAVAYAFTSIILDKFGMSGLHTSLAHSGLPNYLINLLFVSLFSYCWLQLPVSVALQTYLSQWTAARSR